MKNIGKLNRKISYPGMAALLCLFTVCLACIILSDAAYAQSVPPGTCTTDGQLQPDIPSAGTGLISTIVTNVQNLLMSVSNTMYTGIIGNTDFINVCGAAATLYVAIYGILFTFGMVQITLMDFVVRMVKIGIVVLLVSGNSWNFFNTTVIHFFNDGTDDIINQVTKVTTGSQMGDLYNDDNPNNGVHPFSSLDILIANVFSAKMAIYLYAIFFTGPYGLPIGLLLMMALGSLIRSLMSAMWVYLMSLVLKTLLFGLAPIFIICILFSHTRQIFDGWLNQIVNASLQPILLFTFFAFFITLITACIFNIIGVPCDPTAPTCATTVPPVCWTEFAESTRGTPVGEFFWRFEVPNPTGTGWIPNPKGWDFSSPVPSSMNLLPILVFLVIAELAGKFNSVVINIAQEISGTMTDLSAGSEELLSMASGGNMGKASGGGGTPPPAPGRGGGGRGPAPGGGGGP